MMLDRSGSMSSNLQGTLNQLYNLIWFCKRTQIPFEVFAFSDQWSSGDSRHDKKIPSKITSFKSGDLIVKDCNLLQFFSSKMNSKDIYKMMEKTQPRLPSVSGRWIGEMEEISNTYIENSITGDFHKGSYSIYKKVSESKLGEKRLFPSDIDIDGKEFFESIQ